MRSHQFGGVLEVLFEAELEGLADGADHLLGRALGTLQHVAGCERRRRRRSAGEEEARNRKVDHFRIPQTHYTAVVLTPGPGEQQGVAGFRFRSRFAPKKPGEAS